MYLGYLALTVLLILVNLGGLTAAAARLLARWSQTSEADLPWASLRLFAVLLITLGFFTVEHFKGLGSLAALWPVTTALACASLWSFYKTRSAATFLSFKRGEIIFWLGFAYGFAWRFAFPDIDNLSEHMSDLYFITTYMPGKTLPAPDLWLAGSRFDFYYGFQHYAAALMGRGLHLDAGLTMNLSLAMMMGFLTSLVWEITGFFLTTKRLRILLLLTVLMGGNGIAVLTPFMITPDYNTDPSAQASMRLWSATRFSGMFDTHVNTSFGHLIAGSPTDSGTGPKLDLPLETIAYITYLGDYHPPLGGFVLLFWSMALTLGLYRRPEQNSDWKNIALGLTPALMLITNAWTFPLQVLLLLFWMIYRALSLNIERRTREQKFTLFGLIAALALIYPFLSYFATNGQVVQFKLVTAALHTPLPFFLALHWPLLVLLGLGIFHAKQNRWSGWLALLLTFLFILSEVIYIDDPLSGGSERFNTTLKWWSWIWPAALVGLGSVALSSPWHKVRVLTIGLMLALLTYALPLLSYAMYTPKPSLGQMAGNAWLMRDEAVRSMVQYLKNAEPGVVMESLQNGAYSADTAITLYSGQQILLGWANHIGIFRGWPNDVRILNDEINTFYRSDAVDPLSWLQAHHVRYIVWTHSDEQRDDLARRQITSMIERDYLWMPFWSQGAAEIGLWVRR